MLSKKQILFSLGIIIILCGLSFAGGEYVVARRVKNNPTTSTKAVASSNYTIVSGTVVGKTTSSIVVKQANGTSTTFNFGKSAIVVETLHRSLASVPNGQKVVITGYKSSGANPNAQTVQMIGY